MCKLCLAPVGASIAFTYFIAHLSQPGSSLFSYHPPLMTCAFLCSISTAITALCTRKPPLIPRNYKVFVHWTVNLLAGVLAGAGFLSIYINKNLSNKPHFTSWHSVYGLMACIMLFLQLTVGAFAKYPLKLRRYLSIANVRRLHIASGVFTYSAGCTALVLGLFSSWFASQMSSLLVTFMLIGVVGTISAFVGIQILMNIFDREMKHW